jgi:hypothetical protein
METKSRKAISAGHVARIAESKMSIKFYSEDLNARDYFGEPFLCNKIRIYSILKKYCLRVYGLD